MALACPLTLARADSTRRFKRSVFRERGSARRRGHEASVRRQTLRYCLVERSSARGVRKTIACLLQNVGCCAISWATVRAARAAGGIRLLALRTSPAVSSLPVLSPFTVMAGGRPRSPRLVTGPRALSSAGWRDAEPNLLCQSPAARARLVSSNSSYDLIAGIASRSPPGQGVPAARNPC